MGGKNKAPQVKMPTVSDIAPLVDLQAQYNRVGVQTPFGSQRYEIGPDGRSSTLVTDIGPEGRALVGRAMGFANTDSNRMEVPGQVNSLAQALLNRVGGRLGIGSGDGLQLSPRPNSPAAKAPPSQSMPAPSQGQEYGGPQFGGVTRSPLDALMDRTGGAGDTRGRSGLAAMIDRARAR